MALPHNKFLIPLMRSVFIETGTGNGESIKQVIELPHPPREVRSIELNLERYEKAKKLFVTDKEVYGSCVNIEIFHGNTLSRLPSIIKNFTNTQMLIWLDAHDDSHKEETPVLQELEIIRAADLKYPPVILVDDIDIFGKFNTWGRNVTINQVVEAMKKIYNKYTVEFIESEYQNNPNKKTQVLAAFADV